MNPLYALGISYKSKQKQNRYDAIMSDSDVITRPTLFFL